MSREKEMIRIIQQQMPRSSTQINTVFESDAEIVDFHGKSLVYNIDEFSQEDMLREQDPYILGWNMAVGSISDIFASGGRPVYYAHSLVIQKSWTKEYVEKLARGISDVLRELDISFIGGDFGFSETWRYTGSVIGEMIGAPMLRSRANIGDILYITGDIGLGNVEAALKMYSDHPLIRKITDRLKNRFRLLSKEAHFIKKYSECCIDTSDGVFNALDTLSELSTIGFEVGNLPYEKSGIVLSKLLHIPKEILFLGECGEYELLFTINREAHEEFTQQCKKEGLNFYSIGEIKERGVKSLYEKNRKIDLSTYHYSARDYEYPKEYLKDIIQFIRTNTNDSI
ncbi:MAG: AIR synthase related protein [Clostridia bacterium]